MGNLNPEGQDDEPRKRPFRIGTLHLFLQGPGNNRPYNQNQYVTHKRR